ncbi:MAG: glycosyltransferase family 1 protein [Dialister hominis]|uniref:glycosyltransferase family 1 protein n=1 Tax=Dialister hominis TaxID=2582419 RepID=UPI002EC5BB5F|nr:glycosyltransferase family 1 protein [Dialister hominis]
MERKLRVLMVLFNLAVANGVSSYVMNYFRTLNHDRIQMDFVIYSRVETPYEQEIQNAGGHIFLIPSIRNLRKHKDVSERIVREGHYDIVHDNILILSYFIMKYAKKYHVPVRILHSHNSKLGETRYKEIRNKTFMPLLLSKVTDYFACSGLAAKGMFGNHSYTFIPNVISSQQYSFNAHQRDSVREKYQVSDKFIIGTVGRLAYQKNPFYAIDVIAELYKLNKNIEYWWIGDGSLQSRVKEKIHQKGLDGVIRLFGRRNDTADLYQAMDVFFLPSLFEGLPVTALEAQATGLPCLVSDTVSNEFVYTDQVSFFSLEDPVEKVCHMIQRIKDDPATIQREKGKEELLSSPFSDRGAGQKLMSIYEELLK